MKPVAGVQDIMQYMVDPAADYLWESVSTTVNRKGIEERQPRTDAEWDAIRQHAILLTEAANLLLVPDRPVAAGRKPLEGHEEPGNLSVGQIQYRLKSDFPSFTGFAVSLREVAAGMLAAVEARNPQQLLDAGDTLDEVCENCHLRFWYPETP